MNAWMKKTATLLAGGACLAGSFYAGVAYAGTVDPKLDDADANVEKAIALLKAAKNDGVRPPFGGHRVKAVWHGKQMRKHIAKSKKWAENPPPRATKKKKGKKGKGKK